MYGFDEGSVGLPADAMRAFAESRDIKERSGREYLVAIGTFDRFLRASGYTIDKVSEGELSEYKAFLMENYSPRSINLKLSALRSFFKWANREGELEDFSSSIVSVKIPPTSYLGKTSSLEKTRRILEAAEFSEDRYRLRNFAIVCMMARAALSTYDVCNANVGEVGTINGKVYIALRCGWNDEKSTLLRLMPACVEPVLSYLGTSPRRTSDEPLFASQKRAGRLSRQAVALLVKAKAKEAGVDPAEFTPYKLHHTAIRFAIAEGTSAEDVVRMARHADMRTTFAYFRDFDGFGEKEAESKIDRHLSR